MQISVERGLIQEHEADAVIINLFEGVTTPGGATGAVDRALGGRIGRLLADGDFKGKLGDTLLLYGGDRLTAPRAILVGLGKRGTFSVDGVRRAAAAAAKTARKHGVRRVGTIVHGAGIGGLDVAEAAQATVEGTLLGLYRFSAYKSEPESDDEAAEPSALTLVEAEEGLLEAVRSGAVAGQAIAAGVALARDLANHPANTATPTYLAERAGEMAERYGMRYEAWDGERIEAEGLGAFLSVAKGSQEPPRFIILEHAAPGGPEVDPLVLVGKGITFDAGGISLKQSLKMGTMKADMSGAAAVLGAMEVVSRLALPARIVGVVAATENLPSGTATRPGDVVTARNGTTIEILNTDAEGRLVLADALSYARDLRPAAVVDIATLTGATVVALGRHAAGLFGNDDGLTRELVEAGEQSGERVWPMPMWDEYGKMIKSDVADIKNSADARPAPSGAIFGAKFLERFVEYPWAHIDIAGVFWNTEGIPYVPEKGASGFGVRLLVSWLRSRALQGLENRRVR